MPNEQTTVPLFTAGEVLTAADMNLSAGTGVPVFSNTTTRDAGFGGAGEKVLAEGQLCYLSSTNVVQYYDGAAWATVGPSTAGGLTLITAQTIGTAVASVAVTGVFSSTYDNYKIVISGGTASVNDENCGMSLGATTTGYYAGYVGSVYSTAAVSSPSNNNTSSWTRVVGLMTNGLNANFELNGPNLAKRTFITGFHVQDTIGRSYSGYVDNTTQYTAFTITPASGTLTGGTIRVYGYSNS
jgi:hypothetical protein